MRHIIGIIEAIGIPDGIMFCMGIDDIGICRGMAEFMVASW
jgi:hypothetical protein